MLQGEDAIESVLYGPFVDSSNRLDVLLRMVAGAPATTFWPAFLSGWPACDATWRRRRDLLIFLRRHRSGLAYLQGDDRGFFDSLPDLIEVFRGCSRPRVRGVSWTTDREGCGGLCSRTSRHPRARPRDCSRIDPEGARLRDVHGSRRERAGARPAPAVPVVHPRLEGVSDGL
jgi:hypothetical protein